jgi:Fic family protein
MTITDEERSFLVESNAIEREYSEIALEDAIKAWEYAKENKGNINLNAILKIHKLLAHRINPRISGKIRQCPVYIGGECRDQSYEELIFGLTAWIRDEFTKKTETGIKKAHVAFESLHPHQDFNGRTGRILMNIQRLNAGLPILIIYDKEKYAYYQWFKSKPKGTGETQ